MLIFSGDGEEQSSSTPRPAPAILLDHLGAFDSFIGAELPQIGERAPQAPRRPVPQAAPSSLSGRHGPIDLYVKLLDELCGRVLGRGDV